MPVTSFFTCLWFVTLFWRVSYLDGVHTRQGPLLIAHTLFFTSHGILSKSRADFPSQKMASPMTPFSRYTQYLNSHPILCRSPSPRWFSGVVQRRIARFLRGPSEKPSNPYAGPFASLTCKTFSFSSLICYSIAVEPCNSLFLIDVPARHPFKGAVAPLWDFAYM